MNTAAGNGDLELLITEANGEERRFTQPYATLGNLLRQDTWRYSIAAGSYNAPQQSQKPNFVQLVGALGLPRDYTASVGVVAAETYRAAQAGVGKGLGRWGLFQLILPMPHHNLKTAIRADKATLFVMAKPSAVALTYALRVIATQPVVIAHLQNPSVNVASPRSMAALKVVVTD